MLVEITTKRAIEILMEYPEETVLVSITDLECEDDSLFKKALRKECISIFDDAKTIVSKNDDYVKQLRVFTEKQLDIRNIIPKGKQKIILLE